MDLWYNMSLSVKLPNHLLCETPVKQSVFVGADGSADNRFQGGTSDPNSLSSAFAPFQET